MINSNQRLSRGPTNIESVIHEAATAEEEESMTLQNLSNPLIISFNNDSSNEEVSTKVFSYSSYLLAYFQNPRKTLRVPKNRRSQTFKHLFNLITKNLEWFLQTASQ